MSAPSGSWLDEAVADVRVAAREYLGVDLGTLLLAELDRLTEVHHGVARADFQARLQDASRAVQGSVRSAYRDRADRLSAALVLPACEEDPGSDRGDRTEARVGELTALSRDLVRLLESSDV